VNASLALDLPPQMDGTWTLAFQLAHGARRITGTARLTLSNAVHYDFVVQGRSSGAHAALILAGEPADPASKAIRIRTTILPQEGAWATLEAFSGKGYGQSLAWPP